MELTAERARQKQVKARVRREVRPQAKAFWSSEQRRGSSIHEVSYRACFKPQLPAYFIGLYTKEGDTTYDPFSGRGTTAIEAVLSGRKAIANDINPLSAILAKPRLNPPTESEVASRLSAIPFKANCKADIDLSMFYEPRTEAEIVSLRQYLEDRREKGTEDDVDAWIRMVATNRLTGHSPGFFSVYTLPPNQAVSAARQVKINERLQQFPPYRDVKKIILKKTSRLLRKLTAEDSRKLKKYGATAAFLTGDARATPQIADNSVQLTVTSPPFLDVVQYSDDNWLRCWFNALPLETIKSNITMSKTTDHWSDVMRSVFVELHRVTKTGGVVAFEVGEVRKGTVKLEDFVYPLGLQAGFRCESVLINQQSFTKTAHIWGVSNNRAGTNSNRIVVFRKR